MQKLDSRAITQCVFEDEEMSSDSENKLPEAKEEGCNEANALEQEALTEENLRHDAVVECGDKAREMLPGLTGTFSIEINLDQEPASDRFVENDLKKSWTEGIGARSVEIRDQQGSDLMHMDASSSMVVEVTQELGDKSEEPLKAQEEAANESRRSVFFPDREAPSHSLLVFGNSNATPSAGDLINTITPQQKNISGSRKREKNAKPCSSKNIKKKDTEPQTGKLEKRKRKQKKPQKEERGSSSSVSMEEKPIDWPKPCPYFAFEPITRSFQEEDDSVIRRYLEQHYTAAGNSNNLPLPDFGLPSFSKIKISSLNEEEPESKKMKFSDPSPCVQFASSSLDGCSFACTTMQQTVAGN
uniref:Uncharacterized protein n=1 Tax=Noccaea caerulescens TaxID=107243 RepID=A0A1J3DHH3_NOCCA